jgi:hypothetical protein
MEGRRGKGGKLLKRVKILRGRLARKGGMMAGRRRRYSSPCLSYGVGIASCRWNSIRLSKRMMWRKVLR